MATKPEDLGVEMTMVGDGSIIMRLGDLAARRLLLALGVNTQRYGPEVRAILTGLGHHKLGIQRGKPQGEETASPHGPGHDCGLCRGEPDPDGVEIRVAAIEHWLDEEVEKWRLGEHRAQDQ